MEGGLYSIMMRRRCSDRLVRVSRSPVVSIALMYGMPYKHELRDESDAYIACTVVGDDDVD